VVKPTRSAKKLRSMILAEVANEQVCPTGIDVIVRADPHIGWAVDIISPSHIGYANCVHRIGVIVQWLRQIYDLRGPA
jgi:hypothetical protein